VHFWSGYTTLKKKGAENILNSLAMNHLTRLPQSNTLVEKKGIVLVLKIQPLKK